MLVVTEQDVTQLLEFIHANEILAYDTETTGLNVRKDTIMGFGVSNASSGFYVPLYIWSPAANSLLPYGPGPELVKKILEAIATKKPITWNASFDMRITKNNLNQNLLPSLHADVLLMKHTCDEEFPFGLKEVAAKLWGTDVTKEKEEMQASIKANGGTITEYYKADVSVLSRYCIQDCLLTYKLFNHYERQLRQQGLADFYYRDEVLPLYKLVTIPMEETGIRLDLPKLKEAQANIAVALAALEAEIQAEIAPHLEAVFTPWFLNKDYPLQTYKGNITLVGRQYRDGYSYMPVLEFQRQVWRKDSADTYMFNLQSKHHLKKLFFDTLKEQPLSRTPPSKTFPNGQPQVDEEFLELMGAKYAWCRKLIEYNKLQKIKSTYIDRLLEECEGEYFYPSFQQHRTVSGRYAGDMQQLPRPVDPEDAISETVARFTNLIREFIIARPGCLLASADYEQLEPTIFAHTSGDPALQRIFNEGTDFYSEVAIRTESLSGVSSDKRAANYLGSLNKSARQKAKAYALGIAYGMTGYKLKFELNVSEEEAEALVQQYLNAFPKLKEWMHASREFVKAHGYIKTQTGRVRHMPQVKALYSKYGPCIDNDLELWKRYNNVPNVYAKAKADRKTYKNLLNNAINFQVQSLAASIVNRAAIALAHYGLTPLMQVHDELVYEIDANVAETACAKIQLIMQNIFSLTVPLRTVPQLGTNYRQCK